MGRAEGRRIPVSRDARRPATRAKDQGLTAEQLLTLLAKHADAGIPPALVEGPRNAGRAHGTGRGWQTQAVLKVSKPEILEELRKSKAARYLGQPLRPHECDRKRRRSPQGGGGHGGARPVVGRQERAIGKMR